MGSVENTNVKVEIFNQTYSIKGDVPPEYIEKLAEYIGKKMEEVSRSNESSSPAHLAILAALNIADEYFQLKEIKAGVQGVLEDKTKQLISMLDESLIGDIFSRVETITN